MPNIYPSLISADLLNLASEIKKMDPHCDGYHIDVMDNHFVPNLTWGTQFVHAINSDTKKQIWAHLMVQNPTQFIDTLKIPPGSIVSFHIEAEPEPQKIIKKIKDNKWVASLAINPKTDITEIVPFLDTVDHVLVMSVKPGFSGQSFIPETEKKLERLIDYKNTHNLSFKIGIDGGINSQNIENLAQIGIDDFAIASGIFNEPDTIIALDGLKRIVN